MNIRPYFRERSFWSLVVGVLALLSLAAVHWYTDVPNNPNPGGNYAVSLDTQDHLPGGTPYNWISIDQLQARIGSASVVVVTNNTFVNTNVFISTSNAFFSTVVETNVTTIFETNNSFITTNVTVQFPGGFTNLNLTPRTVMYADVNDAESSIPNALGVMTNDGAGGVGFSSSLQLEELDVTRGYITSFFTGLTNFSQLGTDSNGLLTLGSSTLTNINITNAYIQNLTNNTFVNTNIFISTSNAYFSNTVFISTNFSTNLYFVSGKGNTLIITNVNVASGGTLINTNTANNSAVITDSAHAYTNAVNAHGVFTNSATGPPSFGPLQNTELVNSSLTIAGTANQVSVSGGGPVALGGTATLSLPSPTIFPGKIAVTGLTNTGETSMQGVETNTTMGTGVIHSDNLGKRSSSLIVAADISAGISPTLNLNSSTNLIYRYTTNAVTGLTLTFGQEFFTNVSTANITFTAINAQDVAAMETMCLRCTNSSGSDHTVTLPNGIGSPGLGLPPVITITNKQECRIYVQHDGNQSTNCWFIPTY